MENKKPLVSIITPCFNGEKFVHRLFDSLLAQTYKHLELIFVNDGSTDQTELIIKSYIPKFEEQGVTVIYLYQENSGLGAAINLGLKYFTGSYLIWPDSDDFLDARSIERRVLFLEEHQEYGLVRSDAYLYNEEDLQTPVGYITSKNEFRFKEDNLFVDYILENNVIFCPGCHMVRATAFLDVNPYRDIYPARRGQNWQMLLPLVYKYKFGYIDEPLYSYIIYKKSMSKDFSLEDELYRYSEHTQILLNTLKSMNLRDNEFSYYMKLINYKYKKRRCISYIRHKQYHKAFKYLIYPSIFISVIKIIFSKIANVES